MWSKIVRGKSKRNEDMVDDARGEVFGKDLRERIEFERKIYQDPSIMIPSLVIYLVDFIRNAQPRQGVFREVGSVATVSNYRTKINEYGLKPVDYKTMFKHDLTVNDASSILKSYFRLVVIGQNDMDEKTRVAKLKTMVEGLPTINYETLRYLMDLLHFIATRGVYSMDSNNLAVCLNPSICFAKNKESAESFLNLNFIITSLSCMIKNYPLIFDFDPRESEQHSPRVVIEKKEYSSMEPPVSPVKSVPPASPKPPIVDKDDLKDSIQKELDRLDSKINYQETEEELERDIRKNGRTDDYGLHSIPSNFLDKKFLHADMFQEIETAESSSSMGELEEDELDKQKKFHLSLSKIISPNTTLSATKEDSSPNNQHLMDLIVQLQSENNTLRKQQQEIRTTLEHISQSTNHNNDSSNLREDMERIRSLANHELQQLRKYIYNVEEQTIEELKSMWVKMDILEESSKQCQRQNEQFSNTKAAGNLVEEMKLLRQEIRDLYGGFGELNERMKHFEIDIRDVNSRIDEVVKEQRFIKIKQEYDIEHVKKQSEESISRIRQMSFEISTLRSRLDAKTTTSTTKLSSPYSSLTTSLPSTITTSTYKL
ncbi:hypothetical protein FDP41_000434 [Naegleria fowleri]|uniref:Rho-GAP domain-containing protein n=1 Tax=Naegleria fowleri TaxID=5763 RepID=A0A6A5CGX6_NAEFO|nr:uncharacterized protein FDP41_000434 [Naegleria fowleri]KAF0984535.1 hypothetical protein FDP41_000434 [Naegleria fowleri]